MSLKRLAVFGADGFVGGRLIREIKSRRHPLLICASDIRDTKSVGDELRKFQPNIVINAAAKGVNPFGPVDMDALHAVNALAPRALQRECSANGVARFVHLGSCFEFGSHDRDIEEDFPLQPSTPYAKSKAEGSTAVLNAAKSEKCQTLVLRLFGIWGPGEMPHRLVPQILKGAESGQEIPMTKGSQIRDFTFVDDIVADILDLALADNASGAVNVGSGRGVSVLDFAKSVAKILNCENLLRPGALPERPGEMARLVSSVKRLSTLIELRPRTSVEIGLQRMRC